MFFFGSVELPGDAREGAGLPARWCRRTFQTPLAGTSDQDTTDILAGEGKITYQLGSANRFEGYLSKQRYDKPNRGAAIGLDAGVGLQGARHLRDHAARLQPRAQRPDVPRRQGQLQQHAFPAVPEDRPAADDRPVEQQRALSQPHQQPDHVPPPGAGDRQLAVLPAAVSSAAATSSRAGFDNGYTPEDVDTIRVDDVNLAYTQPADADRRRR